MKLANDVTKTPGTVLILHEERELIAELAKMIQSWGLVAAGYSCCKDMFASKLPSVPTCLLARLDGYEKCGLGYYGGLRQSGFFMPAVFLQKTSDLRLAVAAMRAGAEDVLTLPVDEGQLMVSIFRALEKSKRFAVSSDDHSVIRNRAASLTFREQEIVRSVIAGKLNKEIADDLGLALVTVKVHRGHAMHKLGARTPADLIRIVRLAGILNDSGIVGSWPRASGVQLNGVKKSQ